MADASDQRANDAGFAALAAMIRRHGGTVTLTNDELQFDGSIHIFRNPDGDVQLLIEDRNPKPVMN